MAHLIDDDFLRTFFSLGDSEEDRRELVDIRSRLIRISFTDGQDICTVDALPDGMYFLESGVALVLNREGEQINVMHEGQYFGEYGVLAQQRRLSTVRSRTRTGPMQSTTRPRAGRVSGTAISPVCSWWRSSYRFSARYWIVCV